MKKEKIKGEKAGKKVKKHSDGDFLIQLKLAQTKTASSPITVGITDKK